MVLLDSNSVMPSIRDKTDKGHIRSRPIGMPGTSGGDSERIPGIGCEIGVCLRKNARQLARPAQPAQPAQKSVGATGDCG